MATLQLIQDRIISGQGVLRIPDENKKLRYALLYVDVIREPKNKYLNKNWFPDRSKYCYINFVRNGYVIKSEPVEYKKQSFDSVADYSGQTLIALKCAYEGILQTFINLGNAIPFVFPIYVQDLIKDYENLNLNWDEVRIKCYADTAVQVRLYKLNYDACDPDKDDQFQPPPPPPPLPPVPPGTAIEVSEAYDEDDGTEPFPGDEIPEPEQPGQGVCVKYSVSLRFFGNFDPNPVNRTLLVWGVIGELKLSNPDANPFATVALVLECQGDAQGTNPCGEPQDLSVQSAMRRDFTSWEILSITPV